jgi:hypothetical protein
MPRSEGCGRGVTRLEPDQRMTFHATTTPKAVRINIASNMAEA